MMRGCESFVGPGGAWQAHNRKAGGSNPGGREVKFVNFFLSAIQFKYSVSNRRSLSNKHRLENLGKN